MQQAVIDLAESLNEPALVIIEAPTGTGKTEAALYLADRWATACQQRGLYVAMPTIPPWLDRVFRKCITLHPDQRYQTAEDLLLDLDHGLWDRRSPHRRSRAVVIAGVAAAALVLIAAVFLVGSRVLWSPRAAGRPAPLAAAPPPGGEVRIPAGEFVSGMDPGDTPAALRPYGIVEKLVSGPRRVIAVPAFSIDRYEVTNAEYARFIQATGWQPPKHWNGASPPPGLDRHPVVNVSYTDAEAFARWAGKRIPTAEEWERAARGRDGRLYPWGNEFNASRCNTAEAGLGATCPVDAYLLDRSPEGVIGMAGNVEEWTSAVTRDTQGVERRVVCGGSWLETGALLALTAVRRPTGALAASYEDVGFRCVK